MAVSDNKRLKLLESAVHEFGLENQSDQAIEEMSELTKALIKLRRAQKAGINDPRYIENIKEEMVDVQIMLDQLKIVYGYSQDIEESKLIRLQGKVADSQRGAREYV